MSIETTCRDPECGEEFDSRREKCPACGLTADEARAKAEKAKGLLHRTTESLEGELKTLSQRIAADPSRFQQVAEELRRRREVKDEQPAPVELTEEQQREKELAALYESNRLLTLKVTEMEGEQAKLVVEAELHRQQRVEAEEKLALVVRRLPTKREPMTREAARELADRFKAQDNLQRPPNEWVIDAIVEASK